VRSGGNEDAEIFASKRRISQQEWGDKLAHTLEALEIEFYRVGPSTFEYGPLSGAVGLNEEDSRLVSIVIDVINRKFLAE
jgi:hypothetical protein